MCLVATCVVQVQCMSGYLLGPPGTSRGSLRAKIVQLLDNSVKYMFMMVSRVFAFLAHSWRILGYILGTSRGPPGDHAEPRKHQECTKNANIYFYNGFHSWCILGAFLVYLPATTTKNAPRMHQECAENAKFLPGTSRDLPGAPGDLPIPPGYLSATPGAGGSRWSTTQTRM